MGFFTGGGTFFNASTASGLSLSFSTVRFRVPRFFFNGSKPSSTSFGGSASASSTSGKTTCSMNWIADTGTSFIFWSLRPFNLGTGASSTMCTTLAATKFSGLGAASVIMPLAALIRANMSSRFTSFRLVLSVICTMGLSSCFFCFSMGSFSCCSWRSCSWRSCSWRSCSSFCTCCLAGATKKATEKCFFLSATGFFRSASKMATAAAIACFIV